MTTEVILQGTGALSPPKCKSPSLEILWESSLILHGRPAIQQKVEVEEPLA